jgi:hypothetical protein
MRRGARNIFIIISLNCLIVSFSSFGGRIAEIFI